MPPELHTYVHWREVPACEAVSAFEWLRADGHGWLLESALPTRAGGGASFLGSDPYAVARVRGDRLTLEVLRTADPRFAIGTHEFRGDVLDSLRQVLPPKPDGLAPRFPFCGGAVGYLGYELAERFDVHRLHGRDDLGLPDAVLLLVDRVLCIEASGRTFVSTIGIGKTKPDAAVRASQARFAFERKPFGEPGPAATRAPHLDDAPEEVIDPAAYAKAVDAVKQEIAAGNVYQACLTARACRPFAGDPFALYRALRRVNPAPFACFLELPEVSVVGSSPERFLRAGRDGAIESRPIKGTAPRGSDPVEDADRRDALLGSEKDRAENLMIVDLVRNDLGRVCETGSVHVPELMAVEAYASVFQLVSTVRGKLAEGRDVFDAIRATFPPGSMTGAPKIAAMALLDRLEPVRRSVYSGAVGYLDVFGGADLSVVIRTALVKEGRAWLHAGGGVVADSEPVAEYHEAQGKLRPLYRALEAAEGSGC